MSTPSSVDYVPIHKARIGHPFRTILAYNIPYWRSYLGGALLAVVFVVVNLIMPAAIRGVVDQFQQGSMTQGRLLLYFVGLLTIAAVTGVARYWERKLIIGASRESEYDLRNDFFRHVQSLSQGFFHRVQTGDIMARATNDLNYVRMFIGPGVMGTVDMLQLPCALAYMVAMSPKLTAIALVPLPLVSILVFAAVSFMHKQSQRVQTQYSVLTARCQENLAGARVVQAYGIGSRELEVFGKDSERYFRQNMVLSAGMSLAWPLVGICVALILILVIWKGGSMTIEGELALKDLTGLIVCLLMLVWPLAQFGWILTLYQRGAVGMKRLNDIFAETPAIRDTDKTDPLAAVTAGTIRFDGVSFSYGDREVLHDLNFEVPAGSTVAIVGPTGSGKSSIVGLIAREQDPSSGTVYVDGCDIRKVPVAKLRGSIGYVPQDTFLFSDSVKANLRFGCTDATEADMLHAAEVAQFSEAVESLPNGYDTLLGERGVNLSGGQKQRLAIARAVVCNPRILILDDALSSVDTHTEEEILRRLKVVMASRTSVIISHRTSTIQHADQILVLSDGRIVERGTHESLIAAQGLYAAMHERQLLEDELEQA